MPKLYEYFGLIILFYSSKHEPIHVHCKYQDKESKAKIIFEDREFVEVRITEVKGKALLRNKLDKTGDVILCDNKAKNTDIATAMARLFNAVSVQKNKPEWVSCFVTMP